MNGHETTEAARHSDRIFATPAIKTDVPSPTPAAAAHRAARDKRVPLDQRPRSSVSGGGGIGDACRRAECASAIGDRRRGSSLPQNVRKMLYVEGPRKIYEIILTF